MQVESDASRDSIASSVTNYRALHPTPLHSSSQPSTVCHSSRQLPTASRSFPQLPGSPVTLARRRPVLTVRVCLCVSERSWRARCWSAVASRRTGTGMASFCRPPASSASASTGSARSRGSWRRRRSIGKVSRAPRLTARSLPVNGPALSPVVRRTHSQTQRKGSRTDSHLGRARDRPFCAG